MKLGLWMLALCFNASFLIAQEYELKSSTELFKDLKKLEKGQRAMYLAAHPDDENTKIIAWLENELFIETAYLSLTRGDGGQNLIGEETGDALGVIRTHELLAARSMDGGEQYFTRAVDFGYSKSAEESFAKWGKEEILHDVVWAIRKFRPHIIINRFPPTRRAGHGHHEASAILAAEAFELAADPKAFPEQLEFVDPWQPTALYYNTSSWWNKELEEMSDEALREKKIQRVDVGGYEPMSGLGINEIASLARSRHRCQAFGTARDRGQRFEYLEHVKGKYAADIFTALPNAWENITNGMAMRAQLAQLVDSFRFESPFESYDRFDEFFQQLKTAARGKEKALVDRASKLQKNLSGVRIESYTDMAPAVIGMEINVTTQVYNARKEVVQVGLELAGKDTAFLLPAGKELMWKTTIANGRALSSPYWLEGRKSDLYGSKDYALLGTPAVSDAPELMATVKIADHPKIQIKTAVHRKWTDRSIGELVQPFVSVPPAFVTPQVSSLIVPGEKQTSLKVEVYANTDLKNAKLEWTAPKGWEASGTKEPFSLSTGQAKTIEIILKPSKNATAGKMDLVLFSDQGTVNTAAQWIRYDHIPEQLVQSPSQIRLVPLDIHTSDKKVLYVEGSGDETDEALELLGYEVSRQPLSSLAHNGLDKFDVVLIGIRAFNTNEELVAYHPNLMEFVEGGGTVIAQYSTTYSLKLEQLGPYPLKLGRERVTEEDSDVKLLEPAHPVFNTPNKIDIEDFEGWVQERGLYFASEWDSHYKPLIAWHDSGEEKELQGGLLVARYGEGAFVYTGISFFRELPAGVPGAYKLFINLVEYE